MNGTRSSSGNRHKRDSSVANGLKRGKEKNISASASESSFSDYSEPCPATPVDCVGWLRLVPTTKMGPGRHQKHQRVVYKLQGTRWVRDMPIWREGDILQFFWTPTNIFRFYGKFWYGRVKGNGRDQKYIATRKKVTISYAIHLLLNTNAIQQILTLSLRCP